jgi:O-acetylhomoserine (thiol)-lyase
MSAAQQLESGIPPEMVRLSIGIEHIADITDDIDNALEIANNI